MINAKVIGIGAAGNKAAITLIEKGILTRQNVLLLNSTLKDVPGDYKELAINFSDTANGCGKETSIAKDIAINALKEKTVPLQSLLDPDDKMVIIVNSSEGGTGCGASAIIAEYASKVLKTNVHRFVFTGFEEDGKGLKNTVEYFKNIKEEHSVQAISNKKFLADASGNKLKAEQLANDEFARRVQILLGHIIVDSENNIDDTDLFKLSTLSGFTTIEYGELENIKNIESFNKVVSDIIDNTKSLDYEPSAKKLGVILNVSDKTKANIDYTFKTIKDKVGIPFEVYTHVQSEKEPEYIAIIASGMKMPLNEVMAIYNRFEEQKAKVNSGKDEFFSKLNVDLSDDDEGLTKIQMPSAKQMAKDEEDFFSSLGVSEPKSKEKFSNTEKKDSLGNY